MKIKKYSLKTTEQGLSHVIIPLIAVVLIGIGGTYMLVNSGASPIDSGYERTEKSIQHTRAGSRARIIKVARQQLGYAEMPVNKVKFFQWAGDRPGAPGPWCAVFSTWVWHAAGVRDEDNRPYPMRPGVAQVVADGRAHNRFHATGPQPGDAIIYGQTGSGHIGIVERVAGSRITVVEGNAGLKNQADKYVIRRSINLEKPRNIPHGVIYGYVSPPARPR